MSRRMYEDIRQPLKLSTPRWRKVGLPNSLYLICRSLRVSSSAHSTMIHVAQQIVEIACSYLMTSTGNDAALRQVLAITTFAQLEHQKLPPHSENPHSAPHAEHIQSLSEASAHISALQTPLLRCSISMPTERLAYDFRSFHSILHQFTMHCPMSGGQ